MNRIVKLLGRLSSRFSKQKPQRTAKIPQFYDSFESVDYEEIDNLPAPHVPEKLDLETWNHITGARGKKHRKSRCFSWLPRFTGKTPGEIRLEKEVREEQELLDLFRFPEHTLLKPRGYHCARNRPLICVCTCDARLREGSTTTTDAAEIWPTLAWDASWVFHSSEQQTKMMETRVEDRIRDILADKARFW